MNMWFWEFHFQRNLFNGYISCITALKEEQCIATHVLEDPRGDVAGQTVLEKKKMLAEDQKGARINLAG